MISIQKYKINEFAAITVLALYYYSFKNDYIIFLRRVRGR